jgi:DNA-binding NarL/FixJ family response regulator
MSEKKIKLGLIDDHTLFRRGIIQVIESLPGKYEIVSEASNGKEFINSLNERNKPDILICDINMPEMNGFEVAKWIRTNHPDINILILTMLTNEDTMIRMLRCGIKGYLNKDVEPDELNLALQSIANQGYYYTEEMTGILIEETRSGRTGNEEISERERQFLELLCHELTYKEIADKMFLSVKTVDGYRSDLFDKLKVKSRVGLVLYAVRSGIIES